MNPAKLAMTQIQDLVLTCLGTLVSEEKIPSVPLPAFVEVPADPPMVIFLVMSLWFLPSSKTESQKYYEFNC